MAPVSAASAAPKTAVNSLGEASAGTAGALFNNPRGVAVNQTGSGAVPAGTFYVVDSSNNRIQQFGPTGAFVRAWGWGVKDGEAEFQVCKVAAGCRAGRSGGGVGQLASPRGIAVDQTTGVLYVSDQSNFRVDVFSATGAFLGAFGWEVRVAGKAATLQFCTSATGCRAGSSGARGGQFAAEVGNLAVAPPGSPNAGNVYVANKTERRVDEFKPTVETGFVTGIAFVRGFGFDVEAGGTTGFEICAVAASCKQGVAGTGLGQFGGSKSPSDVAVNSEGGIFALDFANKRIEEFSPAALPLSSGFGAAALTAAFGTGELQSIAIDPSATPNHLLVAGVRGSGAVAVAELDGSGSETALHGASLVTPASSGLAVAPASLGGNLYLAANVGEQRVYVLGEAPVIEPVTTFTGTTALFEGAVLSNGIQVSWHFEYSPNGEEWTKLPSQDTNAGVAPGAISVSAEARGLSGSQPYRVRLVQNRPLGGGSAASSEALFTTAPAAPAVSPGVASHISATAASLSARLDPQNQVTGYRFELGPDDCSTHPCAAVPLSDAIGAGSRLVTQNVTGLAPATAYHFRLVATNATGATFGPDRVFTTFAAGAGLPDDRAYEMVSPPDKHGVDIHNNGSVLSSVDGDAAIFASVGSFAGAPSAPVLSYYRATRSESGWATEGISPPVPQSSEGILSANLQAATGDLSRILIKGSPDPPATPGTQPTAADFYRRDLPGGPFENLTPLVPNPDQFRLEEDFAGADEALDTVGIETWQQLTPDAPAGLATKPYVWSDGALHFLGFPPDGAPVFGESIIGAGHGYVDSKHAISGDGSQVAFVARPPGGVNGVYLRLNPAQPQSPLDGAGRCQNPADACTVEVSASRLAVPEPPKPARFEGASASGDKVLFKTEERLLESDTDTSSDLYLYELASADLHRISVDENPADGVGAQLEEVLGSSEDADYVYFAARGLLVPGQSQAPGMRLYVWHDEGGPDGTLAYIATLDPALDAADWSGLIARSGPRVQVSPDGRYFVVAAKTRLGAYDNAGHAELYRYDAQTGQTICISCDPTGAPAAGEAALYPSEPTATNGISPLNGIAEAGFESRNVLDDGRVFFETEDSLTPDDGNGKADVYEWEEGQVSLISSGQSDADSHFANASPSGNDVFFSTRQRLLGADNDENFDLYDARVGGGLAAQNPTTLAPCQAEACRGPAAPTPSPSAIGSASFSGPGTHPRHRRGARRCAHGQRRVRSKHGFRCARRR